MKRKSNLTTVLLECSAAVQAVLLTAVGILHRLAGQKAGVNHHLQFRKVFWMHRYLTEQNLWILAAVLLAAAILLLILWHRKRSDCRTPEKTAAALALLWTAAGVYCLLGPAVRALLVYPYLLAAVGVCWLVSILVALTGIGRSRKS